MNRDDHAAVARQALAALDRFTLPDDAPVLIEGTFVVAYHVMNGLMHKEGTLPEDEHINSPTHSALSLDELPASVRPVWQAFADLQTIRTPYVWSPRTPGEDLQRLLDGFWQVFRDAHRSLVD